MVLYTWCLLYYHATLFIFGVYIDIWLMMWSDTMRCDSIRFVSFRFVSFLCDAIRCDAMRCDVLRFDPIFFQILFYFIQILFDKIWFDLTWRDVTWRDVTRRDTIRIHLRIEWRPVCVHAIWTRLVTGRQSILIFTFSHTIYVKCKFLT